MPIYEYQCKKCSHRFELIQKFSDEPAKKCPECGGKVERLLSAPSVQFKGTGWYATDYAKKSSSGESKSGDNKGEGKKESSSEGARPAEKKESKPKSADKS